MFTLEYFPLKVGAVQGRLELSSNDLGLFPYELNLKAVSAANERELQVRASLGTTQTVTARFVSYAKSRADYTCKVCLSVNPSECRGSYSATSTKTKLVHWLLLGGLLHLVQRGGDWTGPQPAQAPPRCTKCDSPSIVSQCSNHRIAV